MSTKKPCCQSKQSKQEMIAVKVKVGNKTKSVSVPKQAENVQKQFSRKSKTKTV